MRTAALERLRELRRTQPLPISERIRAAVVSACKNIVVLKFASYACPRLAQGLPCVLCESCTTEGNALAALIANGLFIERRRLAYKRALSRNGIPQRTEWRALGSTEVGSTTADLLAISVRRLLLRIGHSLCPQSFQTRLYESDIPWGLLDLREASKAAEECDCASLLQMNEDEQCAIGVASRLQVEETSHVITSQPLLERSSLDAVTLAAGGHVIATRNGHSVLLRGESARIVERLARGADPDSVDFAAIERATRAAEAGLNTFSDAQAGDAGLHELQATGSIANATDAVRKRIDRVAQQLGKIGAGPWLVRIAPTVVAWAECAPRLHGGSGQDPDKKFPLSVRDPR